MKRRMKIILCCSMLICVTVLTVVFLYNNVIYSKYSHDVFEYFFDGKGRDIVADAITNQSNQNTDSVNAYGYNISMISSIYEKETGIGYFVFEINGDVEKLKNKALGNVISNEPLISFQISGMTGGGTSGGEPSFDGDKMYLNYKCIADKVSDENIFIDVVGEDGCIGRFCITEQSNRYETKKTEGDSSYNCVVSPFGIKIKSEQYIEEDNSIIVKYKDNTEEEVTVENKYFADKGEENIYTCVFDEIKDVKDIDSVIVNETECKMS